MDIDATSELNTDEAQADDPIVPLLHAAHGGMRQVGDAFKQMDLRGSNADKAATVTSMFAQMAVMELFRSFPAESIPQFLDTAARHALAMIEVIDNAEPGKPLHIVAEPNGELTVIPEGRQ